MGKESGSAASGRLGTDNDVCHRCGLKISATGKADLASDQGTESNLCQCIPDPTFADGMMTARFLKLKQAGSGTIFSNAPSGQERPDYVSIGLARDATIGGVYKIIEMIGRGGMGEVYLASHETLGKKCALKVIPPDQVTEIGWQRFQQEAKAVAQLAHINLVRVTDLGIHEACLPYFAMDYVEGKNLAEALAEHGPMPLPMALELILQVCDGVECAHHHGILHRDLKPANIMLVASQAGKLQVKVLDFGLAKLTKHDRRQQSLTIAGDIFGSPSYMSPEQCKGDPLDQRSDIYSLGCTFFECLTGRPPYSGHLAEAIIFGHLELQPPTLESVVGPGAFPPSLERVLAKLLSKSPNQRYQNLAQLKLDLQIVAASLDLTPTNASAAQAGTRPGSTSRTTVWPNIIPGASGIDSGQIKPGEVIGGSYQILDLIGSGAMGTVYKAKHVSMPAVYAVKVLPADQLNEIAVLRFQNEAQAIAKLNHPNIISIYNFGLHNSSVPFYVMELLKGANLEHKLEMHGPMPVDMVLPLFIEVCAGLSYAHRKGILHRDVKPANFVILDAADVRGARIKIVDFGMVKFAEQLNPDLQKLTFEGEVCGSPSYMSPEQSSGKKIDARSDVYSLGCSLYQALTGKLAFIGRSGGDTMLLHHEMPAPTLASKGSGLKYSEDLELLVAKMLAKAPMNRYQTMDAVAQDLRNVKEGKALGTPPPAMTSQAPGTANLDAPRRSVNMRRIGLTDADSGAEDSGQEYSDEEHADEEYSGDPSYSAPRKTRLIMISILVASLASAGLLFRERVIPSANHKTPATSPQFDRQSVAISSPNQTKTPEQIETQPLELEGPSGLEGTVPAELTQAPYFSQTISIGGKEFIEFDFPEPAKGLRLAWIGSSFTDSHRAEGKIRFAKNAKIYLMPFSGTVRIPQFFEKFRPGEITGICLTPLEASDELLECALKVPGISQLLLGHCTSLTAKIIPVIGKLNLSVLDVTGSNIDGALLANAPFWQNLKVLNIRECKNVTPILKKLSGSRNMAILDVAGNQLSNSDYQMLSTLSNLKVLNISNNTVRPEDLQALSHLPNLSHVYAIYTRFTDGSSLAKLKHFPALKELSVLRGYLKSKDLQPLRQECPDLKVTELSADQVKNTAGATDSDNWGK